ncbi:MAG: biliverdin-producing heme oxygenase [Chthoniobacteraceae bacterium]
MSTLERLRNETRAAHSELEATVGIERRVTNLPDYTRLLERFYGFYQPLEDRLENLGDWVAEGIAFQARRKLPWLEADLLALQHTPESVAALPRCASLPRLESLANGFGCAYVLEGATLGGRHISSMLRETSIPEEARHFFGSYGPAVGERWREFTASLEQFGGKGSQDEIVEAACGTFSALQHWLNDEKGGMA